MLHGLSDVKEFTSNYDSNFEEEVLYETGSEFANDAIVASETD